MRWSEVIGNSGSAALSDGIHTLSYQSLLEGISPRVSWLRSQAPQAVAIALSNGIEWVLFDMACAEAGIPCIPIPGFFSESQREHALASAGVELLLVDSCDACGTITAFSGVAAISLQAGPVSRPQQTAKITYTSGSTGAPKGVCLSIEQQLATARALATAIDIKHPVHLAVLPLATLLENIAGVYAPLLAGGTVYLPDNMSLGFSGSRLLEPQKLLQSISDFQPDSMILVPELLLFLVNAVASGWTPPSSLQFIAVGGARVAPSLLDQASDCGLPVYQGYGLSECGSVVTLNTPDQQTPGSIGVPLSHVDVAIEDQELIVYGNCFLGYLEDSDSWYPQRVLTGDLVHQSEQGYLWYDGRKRNQMVTSFGRNISPEWPESELLSDGYLRQAVVFGDDRPHCLAIVVPFASADVQTLVIWLERINRRLPDYAQIKQCLLLAEPMSAKLGLYTDNGRPNRGAIASSFQADIAGLYQQPEIIVRRIDRAVSSYSNQLSVERS